MRFNLGMKKTIMITGSSGLIGRGLCQEFIDQNFLVIGLDQKPPKDFKHPNFAFYKCDIRDEDSIKGIFKQINALHGLINNGAIAGPSNAPLEKLKLADWNNKLAANLTSVFLISKHAIPKLRKTKGSIVNVSSTRHLMAEANTEIYCAAKGAVDGLTKAMAISLGPDVRVNSISPGWIADPASELRPEDHAQHPVGRVVTPGDIAKLARYLISEDSGFVTGGDFIIDGGMTKKMIYE